MPLSNNANTSSTFITSVNLIVTHAPRSFQKTLHRLLLDYAHLVLTIQAMTNSQIWFLRIFQVQQQQQQLKAPAIVQVHMPFCFTFFFPGSLPEILHRLFVTAVIKAEYPFFLFPQ